MNLEELAKSTPFSRAVQVACAKLGECTLPCPFPKCDCKMVPGAVRDAIAEWVRALPADGKAPAPEASAERAEGERANPKSPNQESTV